MAVIFKSNLFNLLLVIFLIAAYTSEVTAKPTAADNEEASNDVDYLELEPHASPVLTGKEPKSDKNKLEGSSKKKSKSSYEEKKSKNKASETKDESAVYDDKESKGWDLVSVLDRDDSAADIVNTVPSSRKEKDSSSKKQKSKASKESDEETTDEAEPLPSAQGQKSNHNLENITTRRPRPATTEPSTGSASSNLPRAVCSFAVTIATVMLVL